MPLLFAGSAGAQPFVRNTADFSASTGCTGIGELADIALGDPIAARSARFTVVDHRDLVVPGGCPAASTFNGTQSMATLWGP